MAGQTIPFGPLIDEAGGIGPGVAWARFNNYEVSTRAWRYSLNEVGSVGLADLLMPHVVASEPPLSVYTSLPPSARLHEFNETLPVFVTNVTCGAPPCTIW